MELIVDNEILCRHPGVGAPLDRRGESAPVGVVPQTDLCLQTELSEVERISDNPVLHPLFVVIVLRVQVVVSPDAVVQVEPVPEESQKGAEAIADLPVAVIDRFLKYLQSVGAA